MELRTSRQYKSETLFPTKATRYGALKTGNWKRASSFQFPVLLKKHLLRGFFWTGNWKPVSSPLNSGTLDWWTSETGLNGRIKICSGRMIRWSKSGAICLPPPPPLDKLIRLDYIF